MTDDQGQFTIPGAPVGAITLEVDGTTTTLTGAWPVLDFDLTTISGKDNTIGMPIFLLPLDTVNAKVVGGPQDVTLQMANVPGLALTVFANSVTCPDGSSQCLAMITQVHRDKVPMPPIGGAVPRLVWTVQPAGILFDPPAMITYPNVDGLLPGQIVDIFSFDHDLGEFVSIGTGTVSEDGSVITSDAGAGIRKAGWGYRPSPPPPQTCADACGVCKSCDPNQGLCVVDSALDQACCQRANEQQEFKNQLPSSDPRKQFANALTCVAGGICSSLGPQGKEFDDPNWMLCVNKELFDRWKAHSSLCWNSAEIACELAKLQYPGNTTMQQLQCFGAQVVCHDFVDMRGP